MLLGAAHDGRALRFGGGAVRWFEVDRPPSSAEKRTRLTALGITANSTAYLPLDLAAVGSTGSAAATQSPDDLDAALTAAGHDPAAPTLYVAETTFDSVSLEAAAALCTALRARAASGSVLVATFSVAPEGSGAVHALRSAANLVRQAVDEPSGNEWRPGDPQKLMVVTGWRVTHSESSAERRLDPGSHMLILVCAPDPDRGG